MGRHGQLDADELEHAERDDDLGIDQSIADMAVRNPIQQETAEELVPILRESLIGHYDIEEPKIYITEERLPRSVPAGYSKKQKDHVVDVIVFKADIRLRSIDNEGTAQANIEDLKELGFDKGAEQ